MRRLHKPLLKQDKLFKLARNSLYIEYERQQKEYERQQKEYEHQQKELALQREAEERQQKELAQQELAEIKARLKELDLEL